MSKLKDMIEKYKTDDPLPLLGRDLKDKDTPPWMDSLWQSIKEWLNSLFGTSTDSRASMSWEDILKIFLILLIASLVIIVIRGIYHAVNKRPKKYRTKPATAKSLSPLTVNLEDEIEAAFVAKRCAEWARLVWIRFLTHHKLPLSCTPRDLAQPKGPISKQIQKKMDRAMFDVNVQAFYFEMQEDLNQIDMGDNE